MAGPTRDKLVGSIRAWVQFPSRIFLIMIVGM